MDDEVILALYHESYKIFNQLYDGVTSNREIPGDVLHVGACDFKVVMSFELPDEGLFRFTDEHGRKGLVTKGQSWNRVLFEGEPGGTRLVDPSVSIQDIPNQYSRLLSWCGRKKS